MITSKIMKNAFELPFIGLDEIAVNTLYLVEFSNKTFDSLYLEVLEALDREVDHGWSPTENELLSDYFSIMDCVEYADEEYPTKFTFDCLVRNGTVAPEMAMYGIMHKLSNMEAPKSISVLNLYLTDGVGTNYQIHLNIPPLSERSLGLSNKTNKSKKPAKVTNSWRSQLIAEIFMKSISFQYTKDTLQIMNK